MIVVGGTRCYPYPSRPESDVHPGIYIYLHLYHTSQGRCLVGIDLYIVTGRTSVNYTSNLTHTNISGNTHPHPT